MTDASAASVDQSVARLSGEARAIASMAAAVGAALLVMIGIVAGFGYPPGLVARTFVAAVIGNADRISATLLVACPLLLTGLAVTLAFRCSVWNIGAEGQFLLGAIAAVWAALHAGQSSPIIAIPLVLMAGIVAGGAWAGIAAALRQFRGVSEALATILLNFIAVQLVALAVHGPLVDPGSADRDTSAAIPTAARLPLVDTHGGLHAGIVVAATAAVFLAVFLNRTTWGFRTRIVGTNPIAAQFAGIPAGAYTTGTFLASGALAGLAGAVEVTGNTHYLTASYGSGYGYTAIAVALLARLRPVGVIPAALFFAALDVGARGIQKSPLPMFAEFPTVLTSVAQGVAVLVTVLLTRVRLGPEASQS